MEQPEGDGGEEELEHRLHHEHVGGGEHDGGGERREAAVEHRRADGAEREGDQVVRRLALDVLRARVEGLRDVRGEVDVTVVSRIDDPASAIASPTLATKTSSSLCLRPRRPSPPPSGYDAQVTCERRCDGCAAQANVACCDRRL